MHFELKQQKLCVGFLLKNRQFQEVGHCRRHIFGPIIPKINVEFENANCSCNNLPPSRNLLSSEVNTYTKKMNRRKVDGTF